MAATALGKVCLPPDPTDEDITSLVGTLEAFLESSYEASGLVAQHFDTQNVSVKDLAGILKLLGGPHAAHNAMVLDLNAFKFPTKTYNLYFKIPTMARGDISSKFEVSRENKNEFTTFLKYDKVIYSFLSD